MEFSIYFKLNEDETDYQKFPWQRGITAAFNFDQLTVTVGLTKATVGLPLFDILRQARWVRLETKVYNRMTLTFKTDGDGEFVLNYPNDGTFGVGWVATLVRREASEA